MLNIVDVQNSNKTSILTLESQLSIQDYTWFNNKKRVKTKCVKFESSVPGDSILHPLSMIKIILQYNNKLFDDKHFSCINYFQFCFGYHDEESDDYIDDCDLYGQLVKLSFFF